MTVDEAFACLLAACPSAREKLDLLDSYSGEEGPGNFVKMSYFACHIVESFERGDTSEFPSFFGVLEQMVRSDDDHVRELGTTGIIEDIQKLASQTVGHRVFEPWLGFATKLRWAVVEANLWGLPD